MRTVVYPSAVALAFFPGATARRLRVAYATAMTAALLSYSIVIDPMLCAAATHARYAAGGLRLRMPWQAGVRQIACTCMGHLAAENALPLPLYVAIMAMRAVVPLAARAAEFVDGPVAAAVAHSRLLTSHVAWDLMHVPVVLLCIAHASHAAVVRTQQRAASAAAADKQKVA